MASSKEMAHMKEMQQVAMAYFEGKNQEDKEKARSFFRSLDANGDKRVSLAEYKRHVDSRFSSDNLFKMLDVNGDGTLEFEEVLTLYYMDNVLIPSCSACHVMLLGSSYFSCLSCHGLTSYHLCCACYGGKKYQHSHPSSHFADTHALLKILDQLMKKAEVSTVQPKAEVQKSASERQAIPVTTLSRSTTTGASSSETKAKQFSRTGTVVKKLAICATKTIVIKGVATVAIASGCCIM